MDELHVWAELKEALMDLHQAISMGRDADGLGSFREWCSEHEFEIRVMARWTEKGSAKVSEIQVTPAPEDPAIKGSHALDRRFREQP